MRCRILQSILLVIAYSLYAVDSHIVCRVPWEIILKLLFLFHCVLWERYVQHFMRSRCWKLINKLQIFISHDNLVLGNWVVAVSNRLRSFTQSCILFIQWRVLNIVIAFVYFSLISQSKHALVHWRVAIFTYRFKISLYESLVSNYQIIILLVLLDHSRLVIEILFFQVFNKFNLVLMIFLSRISMHSNVMAWICNVIRCDTCWVM